MSYREATSKAALVVKAKHPDKYKKTNLSPSHQFLGIEIRHDGTVVTLRKTGDITTILRRFGIEHTPSVRTPIGPNLKLDMSKDWGEKELEDITDYQAVVRSLMYSALATWPDILYAVAAHSHYNSRPFTIHMTADKGGV